MHVTSHYTRQYIMSCKINNKYKNDGLFAFCCNFFFIKELLCKFSIRLLKYFNFFFCPQKVEKTTLKSCSEKLKSTFFSLLPKRPKQKNSCSKMWLIDQLYIEQFLDLPEPQIEQRCWNDFEVLSHGHKSWSYTLLGKSRGSSDLQGYD